MIDHPNPGKWNWYASFDGGECFTVGPCDDRKQAIFEAIAEGTGENTDDDKTWCTGFMVAECLENHVDLARFFDVHHWLEWAGEDMDENMCGAGEEAPHPLETITPQMRADLQAAIRSAIRHWQTRKGLPLRSWYFAGVRNVEELQFDIPPEGREELAIAFMRGEVEPK